MDEIYAWHKPLKHFAVYFCYDCACYKIIKELEKYVFPVPHLLMHCPSLATN